MKYFLKKLLCFLIFNIIIWEVAIKIFATKDNDDNYFLAGSLLLPAKIPINESKVKIDKYIEKGDKINIRYDSTMGWIRNVNEDYNNHITKNSENTLKILILGDSFSLSAGAIDSSSWEKKIEEKFKNFSIDYKIFNLATPGYGLDQAYIRWLKEGKYYNPDIVIIGITEGMIKNNLNLIRPIKTIRTGIPFSKPRFIIDDFDTLSLINYPTIAINKIVNIMSDLKSWQLLEYEYFYSDDRYSNNFFYNLKIFALAKKVLYKKKYDSSQRELFSLNNDASKITLKILEKFKSELKEYNAHLSLIHFPNKRVLKSLSRGSKIYYNDLFSKLVEDYNIIEPSEELVELINNRGLEAVVTDHYTALGYNVVGSLVSKYLFNHVTKMER